MLPRLLLLLLLVEFLGIFWPLAMEHPPPSPASPFSIAHHDSSASDEPFHCVICLELVYKPIVQSCGHLFCFWCVHRAMNIRKHSHCPVCRRPYMHFPRVCELLHFMLTKALPEEYERRGQDIQGMEEERQVFSPRFLESPRHAWSPRKEDEPDKVTSQLPLLPASLTTSVSNLSLRNDYASSCLPRPAASTIPGYQPKIDHPTNLEDVQNLLTVEDFLCCSCSKFLYRPVVLNCGEVFCESCLKSSTGTLLQCPSCGNPHRGGSALICLEFHHFLERAFPMEYAKRKEEIMRFQPNEQLRPQECNVVEVADGETEGLLHVAVGCDGCGLFPIVGERHHCRDCAEKIGYDLCGTCYRKGGTLSGRFNQQHKSNHSMEEVRPLFQPLFLNMGNGAIRLRRQQHQLPGDLDEYFDSFLG